MNPRDASLIMDVGDYVTYSCMVDRAKLSGWLTGTGHDIEFYPKWATQWRVFRKFDDQVELISPSGVLSLELMGKPGYLNFEATLQLISDTYINRYVAESARSLGSNPIRNDFVDFSQKSFESFPYRDENYVDDVEYVKKNDLLEISEGLWLASREYDMDEKFSSLMVRSLEYNGNVENWTLYYSGLDFDVEVCSFRKCVCPIIRLKPGILVSNNGDGSKERPYRLMWP